MANARITLKGFAAVLAALAAWGTASAATRPVPEYGPLLFARGIPEKDENTPMPGARTDGWRLDASRVLADVAVVREALPEKWDWPLAAPLRLKVKDSSGEPLELVPYGCAKLRVSMFPDEAGKCCRNR